MECKECKNYVSAFLDEELDQNEAGEFAKHLQTCHECRLLFDAEKRVKELLKDSYRPEKAPFSLRATIRQELAGKRKKAGFLKALLTRPVPAFVSVLTVVAILFLSLQVFRTNDGAIALSKVEIAGHIECISCYLAETEHIENFCEHFDHELGFVSSSNEIFSFLPNEVSQELQSKMEYVHSEAKLTGWVFHQANFIELENYQIIGQAVASNSSTSIFRF